MCILVSVFVGVDNLSSVIHAAVSDLDGTALEDFSELVVYREFIIYWSEKSVSYVFAECRVFIRVMFCYLFLRGGIGFHQVLFGKKHGLGQICHLG